MIISAWLFHLFICKNRKRLSSLWYAYFEMGANLSCVKCRKRPPRGSNAAETNRGAMELHPTQDMPISTPIREPGVGTQDPASTSVECDVPDGVQRERESSSGVLGHMKENGTRPPWSTTQLIVMRRAVNDGVNGSARGRPLVTISGELLSHHSANQVHHARGCIVDIKDLILDTSKLIRTLVDNEQDPPRSMLLLHKIADKEQGWVNVVKTLIEVIPKDDPLGPAVVTLLLEECPLPSREAINKLCQLLDLKSARKSKKDVDRHRNICVVLGCLAEKMAGPSSYWLMSDDVLEYLFSNLNGGCHSSITLFSVIALEKFAQTSENKEKIMKELERHNYLAPLEKDSSNMEDFNRRQVGFCTQWCLDNLFVLKGRTFSYTRIDKSNINVMLNSQDVSEYLKIAPNGLEARCDATSFESVRCTFQVCEGVWYYEVLIVTPGVMQIGWATKDSKFLNYDGYGIGDDEHSIAYDGCRQLIWYNAKSLKHDHQYWKPGDILGLLLDTNEKHVVFSLNGQCLPPYPQLFTHASTGFFAAASFMSFQQCRFNFGADPFRYPPKLDFKHFNECGHLSEDEKAILPRQMKLAQLRQMPVKDDSCTLCVDNTACVTLMPCEHKGFCMTCAMQLEICPMCRMQITERISDDL